MQNLMYVNASNQEDLDFECSGGVWLHACNCLVPCSGLLASVKILVFTGLSSAQCGVFIIIGVFILVFIKKKKINQEWASLFK